MRYINLFNLSENNMYIYVAEISLHTNEYFEELQNMKNWKSFIKVETRNTYTTSNKLLNCWFYFSDKKGQSYFKLKYMV